MNTFISRFLEKSDYLADDNQEWNWKPNTISDVSLAIASTTNCGRTRQYGGGSDVGADDND